MPDSKYSLNSTSRNRKCATGAGRVGAQERGEEAALDQQVVPLERQEVARHRDVGQIQQRRQREAGAAREAKQRAERQRDAQHDPGGQRAVGVEPPRERRQVAQRHARLRARRLDEVATRQQAAAADQHLHLHAQRHPCDQRHQRQPLGKQRPHLRPRPKRPSKPERTCPDPLSPPAGRGLGRGAGSGVSPSGLRYHAPRGAQRLARLVDRVQRRRVRAAAGSPRGARS